MELPLSKVLLNKVLLYLNSSSYEHIDSNPAQKYYKRAAEVLKLLKSVLEVIVNSDIAYHEDLSQTFEELDQYVDRIRELFDTWHSLTSKVYFALEVDTIISKSRGSVLDLFQLLQASEEHLPEELSSSSLERCSQKIKQMIDEQISSIIYGAINELRDGAGPISESLLKVREDLGLTSNQEILLEAVALEKLKDTAEQAEKGSEVEFIDQLIAVVTQMHDRLLLIKQSQTCSSIPIPADFFCPLSLEVMTDPVIVASGQTYERGFIKNWIDRGIMVCPKTRHALTHTNLIPNYTVKALIANWCDSNNVKLPDSYASRDPDYFPQARFNHSMSPESFQPSTLSGRTSLLPLEIREDVGSHLNLPSASERLSSGVIGNGYGVDIERISLNNSEDGSNMDQPCVAAARRESSEVSNSGSLSRNNNSSISASSAVSNEEFSRGPISDTRENSEGSIHATPYSSDASGEMRKSEPQVGGTSSTMAQRDSSSEFSPKLMERKPRNQTIWRRQSERFVPRIVSSTPTEARPDLSGVETQVWKLVEDLNHPLLDTQREATSQLRLLAKHNMDNRVVIAECGAISLLVNLLHSMDTKTQENAVTALLNLSINDNNKTLIASAGAIEPLIHVLQIGSAEAKENAAATLFSLSVIEENKIRIGESGAIGPLVDLLGNGTPRGKKDAATALFNLSIQHGNKARIVQAGAVRHLVELMDPAAGMVDKAVAVLSNLATIPEGRVAIGQEGGIPLLVEVVELGSARGKENAAAALLHLCTDSSRFCNMVLQEGAIPPLVALSQSGTPRAREKAQSLLSYFRNHRHGHGNASRG